MAHLASTPQTVSEVFTHQYLSTPVLSFANHILGALQASQNQPSVEPNPKLGAVLINWTALDEARAWIQKETRLPPILEAFFALCHFSFKLPR